MSKEVQRTRKKEVLSGHFVLSSHVSHSRQSVSKSNFVFKTSCWFGFSIPKGYTFLGLLISTHIFILTHQVSLMYTFLRTQ